MTASQKLGDKIYAETQAAEAAAGAAAEQPQAAQDSQGASKPADDNVVDAEFKEVKNPK